MLPYLSAIILVLLPFYASAQDDVEEDLVPLLERPDEQVYESDKALRLSVGGSAGLAYNDNIYRSDSNEEGDFIAVMRPGVVLRTDMKPYRLDIRGRLEVGEYLSESENSYVDTDIDARAGYDVTQTANVYVGARHRSDHVAIGAFTDLPDTQASTPTDYTYAEMNGGVKVDEPDWLVHLHGGLDYYDYDNTSRRNGAAIINDDRDRDEKHVTLRLGHKWKPQAMVYLQGNVNSRQYDKRVDSTLLYSRDSDGIELLGGVRLGDRRETPLYLDLGIGYLQQDYDAAVLPTVSGLALRGDFQWLPDDFWTIRANLSREVRETTSDGISGFLQTRLGAEFAYQWFSDLKVGSKLRYTHNDFEVNRAAGASPRTDHVYEGGVFADFNFYEDYVAGAEYLHVSRDSNQANIDYDSNVLLMRLGVLY